MSEFNRRNLAPLHCAATDPTRVNLNALRVESSGKTVGTNGHILAVCIPESEPTYPLTSCILDRGNLAKVVKDTKPAKASPAQIDTEASNANGHVAARGALGEYLIPKVGADVEYPRWDQVHTGPQKGGLVIGISLHNLEAMIAAARHFSGTKKGSLHIVKMTIPVQEGTVIPNGHEVLSPIHVVNDKNGEGDRLEFSVMPARC